ncbi:LOW QUALITY PROTEIN: protein scarlet [Frankliniella occidentalis]|uniref:LOW QUALITY PROTEIN: protein scarlet n=1 Tax=Frankliniella occidentalis TaxID=133901 RepID=A0A9C6XBE6_FRAOC|nr:LOW QUALITY PROTEIN: protein scarlet [Frankliniella occidentalis]
MDTEHLFEHLVMEQDADEDPAASACGTGSGSGSIGSSSVDSDTPRGVTLSWRDLTVFATARGAPCKRIIKHVSGAVRPGALVAVMGASGAGKSTLMTALAHRSPAGVAVRGDIRVDGRPVGDFMRRLSGFLHQEDLFVAELTVREHLNFMARMRLDRRTSCWERQRKVQQLLRQLGLTASQHTRIGTPGHDKVISGGERKRLAFATELLTEPPLLFCDEPTTGLDSYSAQQLVDLMQRMTERPRGRGKTILCTIHQPSSDLLARFHRIMLVADGRIAFIGTPEDALLFFREQGYVCPASYNPADFFIRTLACMPGSEEASKAAVRKICDRFAVSDHARKMEMEVMQTESGTYPAFVVQPAASGGAAMWPQKLWLLTGRAMLQVARDPSIQGMRLLQKLAIAVMAGLCFLGTVSVSQTGVMSVQGALFILVSENTFSPMYSVLGVFPSELPLYLREHSAGLYGPGAFYMSKVLSMLPGLVVEPLIFAVLAYWLAGLRDDLYAFGMTAAIVILTMNVSTACGFFFSAAFESVPTAMAYLVPFDYVLMITSGVFVKLSTLPSYVSWTQYLSWLMYSNEAMSILQWQGVGNITCPDATLPCLQDGDHVLDHYSFDATHLSRNIIAMGALYALFHALGLLCLWRRVRRLQ